MATLKESVNPIQPNREAEPIFSASWQQVLAGDTQEQMHWQSREGGNWQWEAKGVTLTAEAIAWSAFSWHKPGRSTLQSLPDFVVEVTISGKAIAAGLSFGAHKDCLVALTPRKRHRLQIEVSTTLGYWCFRVDGEVQIRQAWDEGITSAEDIAYGTLAFKALGAEKVRFEEAALYTFQPVCRLSVITTCYLFLQRLRLVLNSWCTQNLAAGTYEVLVAHGSSPDGTGEYLQMLAQVYPHVSLREIVVPPQYRQNKGYMVNRAIEASRGQWLWLTDADCLYPLNAAELMLNEVETHLPQHYLYYGERRYLNRTQTQALLGGRLDSRRDFTQLSSEITESQAAPWGYTQIIHRSVSERTRYIEHVFNFAQSDYRFIEELKERGIMPRPVPNLSCLHLNHPFSWYGTKQAL
jgi:hypothetical protein